MSRPIRVRRTPGIGFMPKLFSTWNVGMAAANQHEVLEKRRSLHPDPYIRSEWPLVQIAKNIVYQCIILISFSHFGASFMAVTSGLSGFPRSCDEQRSARPVRPGRCPAAGARPRAVRLPDQCRAACRCWPIPTATGTSPSATGSSAHGAVPHGRQLFLHLRRPAVDRQGMAVADRCWRWPTTPAAGVRCRRCAPRRSASPSRCCCACCCATSSRCRPLLFTLAAIVMTAPHFLARPHVLAFPFMLLLGGGPGARRRGAPRARAAAAAGHAAVGQPAWRLHAGPDAVRRLRARRRRRRARCRRAQVRCSSPGRSSASRPLLVACITPYGPGSILVTLPHLRPRRCARHDRRMAARPTSRVSRCRS